MFFGGKGGVGKTTCAAARAAAEAARGARVLAVSTDPAHSLGDALETHLSSAVRYATVGRHALSAVELNASAVFRRWIGEHRRPLGQAIERGTWLDKRDVDALLALAVPGLDELVALLEIVRLARGRPPFDVVVVDTAPTGHTLRLLAAPETVTALATVLDAMQEQHRYIRDQFGHASGVDPVDRFIEQVAADAGATAAMLRDPSQTSFYLVTLPERLAVAESRDMYAALARAGIPLAGVIVNRVTGDRAPCPVCDARRRAETTAVAAIARNFRGVPLWIVGAIQAEPHGSVNLTAIGRVLTRPAVRRSLTGAQPRETRAVSAPREGMHAAPETLEALRGARLVFFGGKGGAGKTTVAATYAIRAARANPASRILLLSTDPAHSLSDVLAVPAGDRPVVADPRLPNLHVRELDAASALAARRRDLEAALDEIADTVGAGAVHSGTSERSAADLMNLAPPGIDELLGILSVVELLFAAPQTYDLIVLDTAPTGHALRLLEMPEAARQWVQVLLRVLLKYRELVRPGRLAVELVDLSKSIRRLQDLLRSPSEARFVVVTRAADLPRLETERLLGRLARMKLAVPALVINARTLAPGECVRCRRTASAERPIARALVRAARRRTRDCVIIQTPLQQPPPSGVRGLAQWGALWTVHPGTNEG